MVQVMNYNLNLKTFLFSSFVFLAAIFFSATAVKAYEIVPAQPVTPSFVIVNPPVTEIQYDLVRAIDENNKPAAADALGRLIETFQIPGTPVGAATNVGLYSGDIIDALDNNDKASAVASFGALVESMQIPGTEIGLATSFGNFGADIIDAIDSKDPGAIADAIGYFAADNGLTINQKDAGLLGNLSGDLITAIDSEDPAAAVQAVGGLIDYFSVENNADGTIVGAIGGDLIDAIDADDPAAAVRAASQLAIALQGVNAGIPLVEAYPYYMTGYSYGGSIPKPSYNLVRPNYNLVRPDYTSNLPKLNYSANAPQANYTSAAVDYSAVNNTPLTRPTRTSSSKAGNTLGGVVTNTLESLQTTPGIISVLAYIMGLILGFMGIIKLKEHVENPNQTQIWDPIKRFVAGGFFFTLPYVINVVTNTVSAGGSDLAGTSYNTAGAIGNGLDAKLVNLMADIWVPMQYAFIGFSYLAGLVLLLIGISRLLKTEQEGARGPLGIGTVMTFLVAGVLLSLNKILGATNASIFEVDAMNSASLAKPYVDAMGDTAAGHANAVIGAIMAFVAILGWISFIRGFFIMRGVAEGNQQSSAMAGITHILGGAVAVNLGAFINAVQNTLGIQNLGLQLSSIEPYMTSVTMIA
jgi:hypothetical protein